VHDVTATCPDTERAIPNVPAVEATVFELWSAFEKTVKDDDESNSLAAKPASPTESSTMISMQSSDELFSSDSSPETSASSDLLPTTAVHHWPDSASKPTQGQNVSDPTKSMFGNAKALSARFIQSLLDSPKVDILNEESGELYLRGVSLDMLKYFGGGATINAVLSNNTIRIPSTHASRDGIVRVIRYMRRCCQDLSRRPTGELRTPPSIKEGIATSLACRFFYLDADAEHMERLVVQDFMGSPRFFITDDDVELIWCGYEETLRDTPFGEALVWFVLENVMSGTHALADEVRWLLEQNGYEKLKARVRYELKKAEWRGIGRKAFLERRWRYNEDKAAVDVAEVVQEGKQ
jgi:hypothetical protein